MFYRDKHRRETKKEVQLESKAKRDTKSEYNKPYTGINSSGQEGFK